MFREGPPPRLDHPSDDELAAFVTGTADAVTGAVVQEHLWRCPACTQEVEALRVSDAEITAALAAARRPAARSSSRRTRFRTLLLLLLALAIVTGVAWCRATI